MIIYTKRKNKFIMRQNWIEIEYIFLENDNLEQMIIIKYKILLKPNTVSKKIKSYRHKTI